MRLLLPIFLLLISCVKEIPNLRPSYQDEAFKPYISCFKQNYPPADMRFRAQFTDDLPPEIDGQCIIHEDGQKTIIVNRLQWDNKLGYWQREFLILHELGHCLMGLEHSEDPLSFITTYTPDEVTLRVNREQFYESLFGPIFELCPLK